MLASWLDLVCDCVASLLFSLGVCMLRVFAVGCVECGVVAVEIVGFWLLIVLVWELFYSLCIMFGACFVGSVWYLLCWFCLGVC